MWTLHLDLLFYYLLTLLMAHNALPDLSNTDKARYCLRHCNSSLHCFLQLGIGGH